MKIKFGSIVTDGRGKLGGQVYARNRSGAYVRNKVTPNNPQTGYQSTARARLAALSEAWRGLSESVRAAWNAATASFPTTNQFGDEVIPTGKNLYTQLNVNLLDIERSKIESPPTPAEIVEPSDVSLTATTAPAMTVDFTGAAAMSYKIMVTPPLSPGVGFFKNKYKMLTTTSGDPATPIDIQSAYAARFGAPALGQKIAVKIVPVVTATGQKGVGATGTVIVAAG